MLTWPAIEVPSASEAEIWCVKLELMAGNTAVCSGMEQMMEKR